MPQPKKYKNLEFSRAGIALFFGLIGMGIFLAFLNSKSFDELVMYSNLQPHSITIDNPYDLKERMIMNVNMYSTTFGAQSDIDTYVTLTTNSTYQQIHNVTFIAPKYLLLFAGSYCSPKPLDDRYASAPLCMIPLSITPDNKTYHGEGFLVYSTAGDYDVLLGYDNKAGAQFRSTGVNLVKVDSLQVTNNYRAFKILATIAIIGSILAFLNFYQKFAEPRHLFFKNPQTKNSNPKSDYDEIEK